MHRLFVFGSLLALGLGGCAESKPFVPGESCQQGQARCAADGAQELICVEHADETLSFESRDCPTGIKCNPDTGRCPSECGDCNQPPNSCYKPLGNCWNGACQYEPYEAADKQKCDDGDPCTFDDTCQGGSCKPGRPKECSLAPANKCVDTSSLTTYEPSGSCEQGTGECKYASTVVNCSLGCQDGECKGDPCIGVTCDSPPGACYKAKGVCNGGTCSYLPDDGKSCDDGDACTDNDACQAGKCSGSAKACDTPPDDTCKDADTLVSYQKVGSCAAGSCSYSSTDVACGHGCDAAAGACSGDTCDSVTCDTPPSSCYKTPGTCDGGSCSYTPDNGKSCDDGDPCSENDTCSAGACKGTPVVCNTPPPAVCKDSNTVTVFAAPGSCNTLSPPLGSCSYASADVGCGFGCDSGACTGDPCAGVTCNTPPNTQCYSVPGICSAGSCTYLPKSGTTCDDGNACTRSDSCKSDGSCSGIGYSCNDSLVCTNNVCDGAGGCSFPLQSDSCLLRLANKQTCVQSGTFNADNACQRCDATANTKYWSTSSGTVQVVWSFDDGTLQGWTVTPDAANPTSPVKWQVDGQRFASAPKSVYFGDPATRTYSDPGKAVSGKLTSPSLTLPAGPGKICVAWKMFKAGEASASYDALTLSLPGSSQSGPWWSSVDDAERANTSGAFVQFAVDVTAAAGKNVKLELAFDSKDSILNGGEGIYVDDVRVMSNCTP